MAKEKFVSGEFTFIRNYPFYTDEGKRYDFEKGKTYSEIPERLHEILTRDELLPTVEEIKVSLENKGKMDLELTKKTLERQLEEINKAIGIKSEDTTEKEEPEVKETKKSKKK